MKSQRGMGGVVSDIMFKNITGYAADYAAGVTMCHHDWAKGTLPTPIWRNTMRGKRKDHLSVAQYIIHTNSSKI